MYLCALMNRRLLHIIEWLVAIAAYIYLAYSLVTYNHYDVVRESLRAMDSRQWLALAACVALMPANMLIEAWRWRTLMPMSLAEAQKQVYYSKLAGIITPWRLGEYPARGMMMAQNDAQDQKSIMPRVLSMGAVGSATMTAAIVAVGALSLCFLPSVYAMLGHSYLYLLAAIILLIVIALALAPKLLHQWADLSRNLIIRSLAQSVVRLMCWCLQLALILYALKALDGGTMMRFSTWLQMPVYYLFVTITPNIPIVEAGVRGAWAMALFGTVNAALAGVLLWAINTLLPCLLWLIIRKYDT